MNKEGVLELDSYRLLPYAVQIPCYVCGGGNTYDAELCRHCFAPMALAHQANSQKIQPRMLATIGPSGVGKTVYLGMLIDMLSRQSTGMQLLARGAFSITLQQTVIGALARCEFPSKTPNEPDRWNWVHCQVKAPEARKPVELIMPDMAGEAILEEVDHPHTYPIIRTFLEKCAGILILVDAEKVHIGAHEQDYFTMKLLSYLCELDDDPRTGWSKRPVALVFTKSDQCTESFEDPSHFAQTRTPGLWQHAQERFAKHQFFATGVAGGTAFRLLPRAGRIRVPLRIEPHGITEPFEWLVRSLGK
jgi:GTPase SAR1 family protein